MPELKKTSQINQSKKKIYIYKKSVPNIEFQVKIIQYIHEVNRKYRANIM
jgi:hypothetical protein